MNYKIRKAQMCDEEQLMELIKKTWNQCFRSFLGDESILSYVESEMARRDILTYLEYIQIIEENKNIIGYCIWVQSLLSMFVIAPEYHRMGIGIYLLRETERLPLEEYGEVILECFEENKSAVSFYEKRGYEIYYRKYDEQLNLVRLGYRKQLGND